MAYAPPGAMGISKFRAVYLTTLPRILSPISSLFHYAHILLLFFFFPFLCLFFVFFFFWVLQTAPKDGIKIKQGKDRTKVSDWAQSNKRFRKQWHKAKLEFPVSTQNGIVALGRAPYVPRTVSQSSPQGCRQSQCWSDPTGIVQYGVIPAPTKEN